MSKSPPDEREEEEGASIEISVTATNIRPVPPPARIHTTTITATAAHCWFDILARALSPSFSLSLSPSHKLVGFGFYVWTTTVPLHSADGSLPYQIASFA